MPCQSYAYLGINFYRWQGWTGLIACLLAEGTISIVAQAFSVFNFQFIYLESYLANADIRSIFAKQETSSFHADLLGYMSDSIGICDVHGPGKTYR